MKAQHSDPSYKAHVNSTQSAEEANSSAASSPSRRAFLGRASAITAATLAAGVVGVPLLPGTDNTPAEAAAMGPLAPLDRRQQAYQVRQQAALYQRTLPLSDHRSNGDEDRYANKIASYTKGLPHNQLGEVELDAYRTFMDALASGQFAAFETLPLGNQVKLANPVAAYAFELEGADPHQVALSVPRPSIARRRLVRSSNSTGKP